MRIDTLTVRKYGYESTQMHNFKPKAQIQKERNLFLNALYGDT